MGGHDPPHLGMLWACSSGIVLIFLLRDQCWCILSHVSASLNCMHTYLEYAYSIELDYRDIWEQQSSIILCSNIVKKSWGRGAQPPSNGIPLFCGG